MNPSTTPSSTTELVDKDLADQARPGHGIPSQDPEAAAQSAMEPGEAQREANSVLAGGGVIVGAAAGAAIGTLVAGPPLSQDAPDATDQTKKASVKP